MGKLKRVAAFSLPETIVALVIILGIFGIATVVLTGTGRSYLTVQKLAAADMLRQYEERTHRLGEFTSDSTVVGEFVLRRQVQTYPGYDSLLSIHYYIYDANRKILADWQSLVRADE